MLTIEGVISVVSLCLTCLRLGYAIGSKGDGKNTEIAMLLTKDAAISVVKLT